MLEIRKNTEVIDKGGGGCCIGYSPPSVKASSLQAAKHQKRRKGLASHKNMLEAKH